ncbi:glycosyltransferase family 4 protein [Pseudomonadales bacterium]|nr:glycosyltransferase family 4 protein [Pseudomonadales bacterium]MDB9868742.1 glycosyltransferase family 4 protein [Pseudomonadales bacterium]
MSINVLFFMGENPFPINNGVTVAVAGLANALVFKADVYIYNYITGNVYQLGKNGTMVLRETNIYDTEFYMTICSPILSVKEYFFKFRKKLKTKYLVGMINDNYTYVLWRNFVVSKKLGKLNFQEIKGLFKIPYVYLAESFLCSRVNTVMVQTKVEKRVFNKYFFNMPYILISTNGTVCTVNEGQIVLAERSGIGFVASFNDSYMKVASWFVDNVWVEVIKIRPDLKLHVLGKNTSKFLDYISKSHQGLVETIIVEEYYEDISAFYLKRSVVVSPIFKNYGLINKTVEAMQCGCIVIGDEAAFNGLEDIVDGEHCFIANTPSDFTASIINVFSEEDEPDIRLNAYNYISEHLDWNENAKNLLKSFEINRG